MSHWLHDLSVWIQLALAPIQNIYPAIKNKKKQDNAMYRSGVVYGGGQCLETLPPS